MVEGTPDRIVVHCWSGWDQPGSTRGQINSKALWQPNLVERTPDQNETKCWGQMLLRSHPGSTRGQNASICLWPLNLVKRIRDQGWSQRSCRGHPWSPTGQMFAQECPLATQFSVKEPLTRVKYIAGVKSHAGPSESTEGQNIS